MTTTTRRAARAPARRGAPRRSGRLAPAVDPAADRLGELDQAAEREAPLGPSARARSARECRRGAGRCSGTQRESWPRGAAASPPSRARVVALRDPIGQVQQDVVGEDDGDADHEAGELAVARRRVRPSATPMIAKTRQAAGKENFCWMASISWWAGMSVPALVSRLLVELRDGQLVHAPQELEPREDALRDRA